MPKVCYRIWQSIGLAVLIVIVFAFSIRITYGLNLIGSFVNGEGSIGFWMRQGFSFNAALGIAIGCSSFDTFGWFLLFQWLRNVEPDKIQHRWRRMLYLGLRWFGRWLGHLYVPNQTNAGVNPHQQAPDRRHYLFLLLFGAYPGLIQVGVNYALNFRLKQGWALLVMISANMAKMISFAVLSAAYGIKINPAFSLLLLLSTLGTAHLFKRLVEKKIAAWSAEVFSAPMSLGSECEGD